MTSRRSEASSTTAMAEESPVGADVKPSLPSLSGTLFNLKLGSEMVDIYVGPEEKLFRVHKKRLASRIQFFEKMFNGGFKEATEGIARLPEDDPAAFDLLIEWAYSPSPRVIRELLSAEDKDGNPLVTWDAVEFFTLAEKYCLPQLQDIIMDVLIRSHLHRKELPSADFVFRAYSKTSHGSPIARYALKSIYYVLNKCIKEGWETADVQKLFKDLPNFAFDYIELQRSQSPGDPRKAPKCEYHTHGEDDSCPPPVEQLDKNGNPKKRKARRSRKPKSSKKVRIEPKVESEDSESSDD